MKNYNHSTNPFSRKTHARIFTDSSENVEKIKSIMKEMDEFEYDYFPEDLITYSKPFMAKINDRNYYKIPLVYIGKFDEMDMNELSIRCMMENIPIYIWYGNSRDELEFMEV